MIRTSHVGSLPRPPDLLAAIAERERGGPELDPETVRAAVAESVRRQVEVGLDIVNDGESAKVSYVTYVRNRLTGFAPGSRSPEKPDPAVADFPEWAAARRARRAAAAPVQIPVCRDEIHYPDTAAVDADIAALQAALAEYPDREAFLTAASTGVIALFLADEHYRDREAYLDALAEAMKVEYDAVYAAGLLLQLDCPDLAVTRAAFAPDENGLREYRWLVTQNVAALNQALRDIPPERVRLHMCWGNYEGPHHRDVALRDVLDIVLGARAQTISFEGANPRHGHEWALFEEITLPADKAIMPGVIDSTTHYVEHPDLVAQRIERYAAALGEQRVVAATDCGMATFATADDALDARVAWAKLGSLVEGAALVNGRRTA
jgi:5-methyltetrahydropteroyltriglutamate--homocysteine methyltransferase